MSRGDGFEFRAGFGTLLVGYNPWRKSPCLTLVEGGLLSVVAYFRSEEDAVKFIEHITGERVEFKEPDGH